jgi:hypothetical protein
LLVWGRGHGDISFKFADFALSISNGSKSFQETILTTRGYSVILFPGNNIKRRVKDESGCIT